MTETAPRYLSLSETLTPAFCEGVSNAFSVMRRIDYALISPVPTLPNKRDVDALLAAAQRIHNTLMPLYSKPRDSA